MIKLFDRKQFVRRRRDNTDIHINMRRKILFDLSKREKLRARNRVVRLLS